MGVISMMYVSMVNRLNVALAVAACVVTSLTAASHAAEAPAPKFMADPPQLSTTAATTPTTQPVEPEAEGDFRFITRFGIWGMNVDGDADIRNRSTDFSMDTSDLLENTNFALFPNVELGFGKWSFIVNSVLTQLEGGNQSTRTIIGGVPVTHGVDATIDMYIIDFAVAYELFKFPLGDTDMTLAISPAAGLRYTYLDVSLDSRNFGSRSRDADLFDPFVGARIGLQVTPKVGWRNEFTIGGFGCGSDLTWSAQSTIDWRLSKRFELNLGYRAMGYKYSKDSMDLDMTLHGPWLGFSAHWR